jgi:hypothetical protein
MFILKDYILSLKPSQLGGASIKIKNSKELIQDLKELTKFLPIHTPISDRIYYVYHSIIDIKKCKNCDIDLKNPRNTFCSKKCNAEWHRDNTNKLESLKLYGKKYIKNLSDEEKYLLNLKKRKTLLSRYGVDHNFKIPEIIESRKKTWQQNLGVDNPLKNENIKNKISETNISIYGNSSPLHGKNQIIKKKETWQKNLGVDNPSKSDKVKIKKQETCLKNYGVKYPSQNKEIVEKQRSSWVKNKIEGKHNNFKYKIYEFNSGRKILYQGDEGIALDQWILKKFEEDDIINDIKFMYDLDITYPDDVTIKERIYIPDFYIKSENLIIEVKSLYFYKKLLSNIHLKALYTIKKGFNFILLINTSKKIISKSYEEIKTDFKKIY